MNALDFAGSVLALYAVTKIVTSAHIMKSFRAIMRAAFYHGLPQRAVETFVKVEKLEGGEERPVLQDDADLDLSHERDIRGYDYISCPVCVGVALAIVFFVWTQPVFWIAAIYGGGLFLEMVDGD